MRRMITSKQAESTRILSGITEGSKYYEEPTILPNSMIFDEVNWDNSEVEYTGNGKGTASLWLDATNVPEHFAAYDDYEAAPCGNYYLSLTGLPETITNADELIEFMKQGKLTSQYIEESELQEWDIGYIYPDEVSAVIEPQEEEFNPITLVLVGKVLKVIGLPTAELLANGDMDVTKNLKVGQDMQVGKTLRVNDIYQIPGKSAVSISNLKVYQNVNVDGWIAGKEQTWGYNMTESISVNRDSYHVTGSASFGNGQKGELKVVARVDDDSPLIIADFEFNQAAVNDQYVQFTYPIRYLDANEDYHLGYMIVSGKLVGSNKKSDLTAYILGDNGEQLTLALIDAANYSQGTYGIKIEVLPH